MAALTTTRRSSREDVYSKAARLLVTEGAVHTYKAEGTKFWVGAVRGDHGTYPVFAIAPEFCAEHGLTQEHRIGCRCRAGRFGNLCAHALVGEEMRCRGDER